MAAIAEAEVYFGFGITARPAARRGAQLRWVHSAAAGVGNVLKPGIADTDVLLTNSAGMHACRSRSSSSPACCTSCAGSTSPSSSSGAREWSKAFFVADDSPLREMARSAC